MSSCPWRLWVLIFTLKVPMLAPGTRPLKVNFERPQKELLGSYIHTYHLPSHTLTARHTVT